MGSGKLKHLVLLQSPPASVDGLGQPTGDWTTVSEEWADIRVLSGVEQIKGDAEVGTGRASVRIRRRTGVQSGWRLLHGSVAYNIQAVPPVCNDPRYLDLPCQVVNVTSV